MLPPPIRLSREEARRFHRRLLRMDHPMASVGEALDYLGALKAWDSKLMLHKQRFAGSAQNASKYMWFNRNCLQFRDNQDDPHRAYIEAAEEREEEL